jgi:acetate kinase
MTKILVLNCGSSSIKYELFNKKLDYLLKGLIERIGEKGSRIRNHEQGVKLVIKELLESGKIRNIKEIKAVGHRAVHGGNIYKSSLITNKIIKVMKDYSKLAPLHNPVNLKGIYGAKKVLPRIPHVAVFDTSFHQTMPEEAFIYAIPYEYYTKNNIRRYGFHGTSHKYVAEKAANLLKKPFSKLNIITCHLGAGCSIAAVKQGRVIDTSMGLTPLEGVVMGTRCGDIDAGILIHLANELKMSFKEIDHLLNKESGLRGLSGVGKDMRVIWKNKNKKRCKLAMKVFSYRLKKYLGAYMAALGKVDVIVFTGGLGENAYYIRELALNNLNNYGIKLDKSKNKKMINRKEGIISAKGSKVKLLVVPTNEQLMIAKETKRLVRM